MKLTSSRFILRYLLIACIALCAFLAIPKIVHAQKADTTSSGDVQFTSIPTAADSIAMRKKMNGNAKSNRKCNGASTGCNCKSR